MKDEARVLKENVQQVFTDEMLSFLYSSTVFQSFSEEEQRSFIKTHEKNVHFHEIIDVAKSLQEVIFEVEQTMDELTDEVQQFFAQPKKSILNRVKIEENIIYVPFDRYLKDAAPLVVCVQQGEAMKEVEQFCKGMMMSLFDLCLRQRRDLIIIPFAEEMTTLKFEYGHFSIQTFDRFIQHHFGGEARLIPVLNYALELFDAAEEKENAELMLITNNHFSDYDEEVLASFETTLANRHISVSAMAMSEELFNHQPLHFLNKVFFVNE